LSGLYRLWQSVLLGTVLLCVAGAEAREDFVADIENDGPVADSSAATTAPGLDRRLFFFKTLLGAATIATAATVTTSTPAEAQRLRVTDSDPYDREGRGRGRFVRRRGTDNDPYDAEGRGRVRVYRRRVRSTDNDPRDPRGRGRGW
jgi:hypothetical protein